MREIAEEGFSDKMVPSYICNINTQKISIEKKLFSKTFITPSVNVSQFHIMEEQSNAYLSEP